MIAIPAGFAAEFTEPAERDWIAALPGLVERYLRRWSLHPDGGPMHGTAALVLPVRMPGGQPAVLKLTWPHAEALDEPVALAAWDGAGAVRLLAHDSADNVLLLERLDSACSLLDEPITAAVTVAATLLRRLAVPAPPLRRDLATVASAWQHEFPTAAAQLGDPVPATLLRQAIGLARSLASSAGTLMVNEDLHYENVLAGQREPWLVIDPKVVRGDPEFGVLPLLRNRFTEMDGPRALQDRFNLVVDAAELDRERALAWTFVRAIDDWLYFLDEEDGVMARNAAVIATHFSARV